MKTVRRRRKSRFATTPSSPPLAALYRAVSTEAAVDHELEAALPDAPESKPAGGKLNLIYEDVRLCCGINLIGNFGATRLGGTNKEAIPLDVLKKELLSQFEMPWFKNKSMAMIALNNTQDGVYSKTLKELGFKMVSKGYNRPHNSMIMLYTKVHHKPLNKELSTSAPHPTGG